jgi:hypothetical protein
MSINPLQSASTLNELASALVSRFDLNKDGQLTTEEFTQFLSSMLGSAGLSSAASTAAGTTAATGTSSTAFHGTVRPRMSGFSAVKLADESHTTIKYKFGRVAQRYSLEGVHDKASAQDLLTSMKSDFDAAGLNVVDIKGDSIKIKDNSGQESWIDVIYGANGRSPAWQWLV